MMAESMIECVAQAICLAQGEHCPTEIFSHHRDAARAAIKEIRDALPPCSISRTILDKALEDG